MIKDKDEKIKIKYGVNLHNAVLTEFKNIPTVIETNFYKKENGGLPTYKLSAYQILIDNGGGFHKSILAEIKYELIRGYDRVESLLMLTNNIPFENIEAYSLLLPYLRNEAFYLGARKIIYPHRDEYTSQITPIKYDNNWEALDKYAENIKSQSERLLNNIQD